VTRSLAGLVLAWLLTGAVQGQSPAALTAAAPVPFVLRGRFVKSGPSGPIWHQPDSHSLFKHWCSRVGNLFVCRFEVRFGELNRHQIFPK